MVCPRRYALLSISWIVYSCHGPSTTCDRFDRKPTMEALYSADEPLTGSRKGAMLTYVCSTSADRITLPFDCDSIGTIFAKALKDLLRKCR